MRRDQDDDCELTEEEALELEKSLDLDKPAVITKPGRYRMRNGMLAQVSKTTGGYPYTCVGTREQPTAPAITAQWAASGRFAAAPNNPFDIVSKA